MAKLQWDQVAERFYETGVSHTVLFPIDDTGAYEAGVAWSGVESIEESPSGAESTPIYADNIEYLNLISVEKYGATINAFQSPPEFKECDGSKQVVAGAYVGQQPRKGFGLCFRTLLGNDVVGDQFGFTLHFVYNAKAAPSSKTRTTVNETPEATPNSWTVTTTAVPIDTLVGGKMLKPAAKFEIKSNELDEAKMTKILDIVYGKDADGAENPAIEARMPSIDELITILQSMG